MVSLLVPESVRWLLVSGKRSEGLEALKRMAIVNRRPMLRYEDRERLEKLLTHVNKARQSTTNRTNNYYMLLSNSSIRYTMLILSLVSFCGQLLTHGLDEYSGRLYPTMPYISVAVNGATRVPVGVAAAGVAWAFGRRSALVAFLAAATFLCAGQLAAHFLLAEWMHVVVMATMFISDCIVLIASLVAVEVNINFVGVLDSIGEFYDHCMIIQEKAYKVRCLNNF